MSADPRKIASLEARILEEVRKTNPRHTVSFHYELPRQVRVTTYNPATQEFFLLRLVNKPSSIEEALLDVIDYLVEKETYNSYTVIWSKKRKQGDDTDEGTQHKSYFYCNNIRQVLDKFYDGKDEKLYEIYEIRLNSIA